MNAEGQIHHEPFAIVPERLLDDEAIGDRAVRLFAVLDRHANADGRSFPGRRRLAERLRCSVDTLDRAAGELVAAGYLIVEPRFRSDGSQTSNDYWLWPSSPDSADTRSGSRTDAAGVSRTDAAPMNESQLERESVKNRARATDEDPAFSAFWAAYPRKQAKGAARKAWPGALKAAGDSALVIAGAERYRDDPNRDAAYTAHAATWLRAERWIDEPLPPRSNGSTRPANLGNIDTDRSGDSRRIYL